MGQLGTSLRLLETCGTTIMYPHPQALSVKNFKTGTWDEANYSVYFSLECAGLLTIPVVHIGQ